MNLPFSMPRPNMDRLNFIGRTPRGETAQRYQFEDEEEDSDRRQLSPRAQDTDLESQLSQPTRGIAERPNPSPRSMLPGWFRPAIPSFFSTTSSRRQQRPRPSSSRYSSDSPDDDLDSPKTPPFPRLNVPNLPSTRLHLPHLSRPRTQGSNGPASRPQSAQRTDWTGRPISPARTRFPVVAGAVPEPVSAVPPSAAHGPRTGGRGGRRRLFSDPEEGQLAALAEDGRRRRQHRRGGSGDGGSADEVGGGGGGGGRTRQRRHGERESAERRQPPKHFLFCFPWIKSRELRSQILRCFVSGMFLTLLLAIYLALAITKNINSNEFTVLLILIIVFATIFFCHGLIRLCTLIVRTGRKTGGQGEEEDGRYPMPEMFQPGGFAVPRRPIRVVLARDEEAAGIESAATKTNPPAYGLWRESVRVDPNRLYWMRNEVTSSSPTVDEEGASSSGSGAAQRTDASENVPGVPRPPSYASDDGVSYVVEALPRSVAPGNGRAARTASL